MQLMLDRGEQFGWLDSPEIIAELIVSIAGFYYFFAHPLTTNEPSCVSRYSATATS